MTRAYIVCMAVLSIVLMSGCTQFYPTGKLPAQTGRTKPPEEVEVVLTGRPTCLFRDLGTVVSNQNMYRELSINRARSKAGEIGADGIYDLQFTQTPVAVGGMAVMQHIVQAKAYLCEQPGTTVVAGQSPDLPPSPPSPAPVVPTAALPQSQYRRALLIGNAAYADAPLRNPVNDATDMADTLRQVGFEVTLLRDADKLTMEQAIEAFTGGVARGSIGLFFFSGHGVQIDGLNYLIPLGARLNESIDVKYRAVAADWILGRMEETGMEVKLLILDACRNNPFGRSWTRAMDRGLAVMDAPKGSLIAYATSPKKTAADGTGRNSPYTARLLREVPIPGRPIELVFKAVRLGVQQETQGEQTPWEASSLTGEFYFAR